MSITTRLLIFFLAALGVVLAGFSVAIYLVASWSLHAQLDDRLQAAFDVMVASIEVHHMDVEWEPEERAVTLGSDADPGQVRWVLHDEKGRLVDHSQNLTLEAARAFPPDNARWRMRRFRMDSGDFSPHELAADETPVRASASVEPLPTPRTAQRESFTFAIGLAEEPVDAALWRLAMAMTVVSLGIWLCAVVMGHWFCGQALWPLAQMAAEAREIRAAPESRELLGVPPSQDEIADVGQAFNELLASLREQIERQRRFSGDASHQLRTPLAAILTTVEVAARDDRDPAEYRRVLEIVHRRGKDLQKIIEVLLTLSRGEAPTSLAECEAIDLNVWCRERLNLWRDHERAADLLFKFNPEAICLRTQVTSLGQIFDNVLDNACKYSPAGSPITIEVGRSEREATVCISDRGQGIAPAELEQIFEPFFRSEQSRWQGTSGVGLGLSIAHRLAAVLGGRLTVESTLGVGSTFQIALPPMPPAPLSSD